MQQVKIFAGYKDEHKLQEVINDWFIENDGKVKVIRILQSQSGDVDYQITISIFYYTSEVKNISASRVSVLSEEEMWKKEGRENRF